MEAPAIWISIDQMAQTLSISPQAARRRVRKALKGGRGCTARCIPGRGGRSGVRYEILLSSLSEPLQRDFNPQSEELHDDTCATIAHVSQPKFIAAPNQGEEERRRRAVLRLIEPTERGSPERGQAIRDASHHHDVPVRTIQGWVAQCERHGWDEDALGRKRPTDAGKRRVWVSRAFDRRFLAAGLDHAQLEDLADWTSRAIAGIWQSPVQRAGWKRVRLEALTSLRRECRERGFDLPAKAFDVSRRRIEDLRFHRAVDIMANDAKRHDDTKPRIRRDNSRWLPMEQVVMDVKPIDCVLERPDGSRAYPKFIAFLDSGTSRVCGRIVLLKKGEGIRQEHVTDAFIDMVRNANWGFPQSLYYDNGSEYSHFELIREALKMCAPEGFRVLIKARPYSGASKPIESKFAVLDRQITALMDGYTGSNRMDKKVQRVGRDAMPFWGPVEAFEEEFFLRLADFHSFPIASGPFAGRSPSEIYRGHCEQGWRPVSVHPLALDSAFAKQLGERKIDRGAITIGPNRYRHPDLAAHVGRRVRVVQPYRRETWPLAELPGVGWVALEPEMLFLPGAIDGARETSRRQKDRNRSIRDLKAKAIPFDQLANVRERVTALPSAAAPAPLMDVMMSPEAERFAGARIAAEEKRAVAPDAKARLIKQQRDETERLERYLAARG